ncbi:Permease of the drug/metabolite transporter (DMT) superfamily [Prauserella flava]|uniref:Drug/metabolite transporter (DMT)-like permease n=1 Tax=Prauserella sediminis TaxID=577680 RepID=A0A839XSV8_9PSEU|nr:drug/metabolite transporter (DMT)-like permease [Prauserella sediminis]MCR3721099.1 Permease of the drug/metabolite transporter (DMT) superfamily [Prauserella flava]MCR3734820.1 Permease of the drug/metabolite transporter (DMT) superfamily [Prauserella salsuginis]
MTTADVSTSGTAGPAGRPTDRTWLVAVAAALWGTDGLLRLPLAADLPSGTVVFWEHLIIVAVLSPFVPRAVRALARCGPRVWLAVLIIGGGSSALATALFTAAFQTGDAITPLVLQKLQPVFAVLAAWAVLGERLRSGYALFAVPAIAGAWLLAFADPLDIEFSALRAALLALGAAALWAAGTVLGRLVSTSLPSRDVTTLRFTVGLPVAAIIVAAQGNPYTVDWDNAVGLGLLALIPGLFALSLYYTGLRATPAARATLAELAYPATAVVIGVSFLDETMTATQWAGLVVVVAAVTALGWHERAAKRRPVVVPPEPVSTGGRE